MQKLFQFLFQSKNPTVQQALDNLLRQAIESHQVDGKTAALIHGAMALRDMHVSDIMLPRSQIVDLSINLSLDEMTKLVTESTHSRFPVFDSDENAIIGLLLAKDLLKYVTQSSRKTGIRQILRQPYFVPASKRLNHLLNDFQHQRHHLALVNNEHGELAGMITIEDILEQVVGEIVDEHDIEDHSMIIDHGDNSTYTIKTAISVEEFNEVLGSHFDIDKYHTIGGWIMDLFGYVPKKGETITYKNLHFQILRVDLRQIHLVKVVKDLNFDHHT